VLGPDRRGVEDLGHALHTVLTAASHREAATAVADEIAAMPAPHAVALRIEVLAAR
jgi:hypothetical protein